MQKVSGATHDKNTFITMLHLQVRWSQVHNHTITSNLSTMLWIHFVLFCTIPSQKVLCAYGLANTSKYICSSKHIFENICSQHFLCLKKKRVKLFQAPITKNIPHSNSMQSSSLCLVHSLWHFDTSGQQRTHYCGLWLFGYHNGIKTLFLKSPRLQVHWTMLP